MARHHAVERAPESRCVERPAQPQRDRFVERARSFIAQLRGQPDLGLLLGQRNLQRRRGGRERGNLAASEDAGRLEFVEALRKRARDVREVGIGVRGGQEAREAFLDVHAPRAQVIIEQARELLFVREVDIEQAAVRIDPARDAAPFEVGVEARHERGGARRERFL